MIDLLYWLQFCGLSGGLVGAALVTSCNPCRRVTGFVAWTFGNSAWVLYAALTGSLFLGAQFSAFLLFALVGLRNNRLEEESECS